MQTFNIKFTSFLFLSTALVWIANPLRAQTHFTDVHAGLAIHGAGDAAELGQLAAQLYKSANDDLGKWTEQGQKNKLDAAKPADVAKMYVQIQQVGRAGRHLSVFGEPAGPDYIARQTLLSMQFSLLFENYKSSVPAQKYAVLCRQELAKNAKARDKALESIGKLAAAKKFVEAEREMDAALDSLDALIIYLRPEEVSPITTPFQQLKGQIDPPARQLRVEHAQKLLVAARDAVKSEGAATADGLADSVKGLASAPLTSGPELVAQIEKTLTAEHAAMLRRRAIEMARLSALEQSSETPQRKAIEDQYAALHKKLVDLVPAAIAADAARVNEKEVAALYEQYLAATSALLLKLNSDAAKEAIKKALAGLAAKSPALAAEVVAEESMSREHLRWLRRTAEVQAQAKIKDYPRLASAFQEGATVDVMNFSTVAPKTLAEGFFYPNTTGTPIYCQFWGATPRMIAATQPKLANKAVSTGVVFPLESGGMGVARYSERTIAMIATCDFSAPAVTIQTALLGEGKAPRSLDVAMAIEATKRGWLKSAGGAIEDMFAESVLSRFAKTPEAIAHLTPLGTWNEEPKESLLRHALGRFVLKPAWYQGEYFFAVAE